MRFAVAGQQKAMRVRRGGLAGTAAVRAVGLQALRDVAAPSDSTVRRCRAVREAVCCGEQQHAVDATIADAIGAAWVLPAGPIADVLLDTGRTGRRHAFYAE